MTGINYLRVIELGFGYNFGYIKVSLGAELLKAGELMKDVQQPWRVQRIER